MSLAFILAISSSAWELFTKYMLIFHAETEDDKNFNTGLGMRKTQDLFKTLAQEASEQLSDSLSLKKNNSVNST